jgi:hypothetical protein
MDNVTLLAIENHRAPAVTEQQPWAGGHTPAPRFDTKAEYSAWCKSPDTHHVFFSAFEGYVPNLRCTKEKNGIGNDPYKCRGLVADYDNQNLTVEKIQEELKNWPSEYRPNFFSMTQSNGARLIWLFEEPVIVHSYAMAAHFNHFLASRIFKLKKALPGLDEGALKQICQYYELGYDWHAVEPEPIPKELSWMWLTEACRRYKKSLGSDAERKIPIEKINEQLAIDFKDKLDLPVKVGDRVRRFWDDSGTNEDAAVVLDGGIYAFTNDDGFKPWSTLFGAAFVERFEADRVGKIQSDFYYDGQFYWDQGEDGKWRRRSESSFRIAAKVNYSLEARTPKGMTASEVERAIISVQENKSVHAALPFIHMRPGPIRIHGKPYMNTADALCIPPAEEGGDWGEGFPWLAEFLDGFFDSPDQLPHFLGWWKRFYKGGLDFRPLLGHALFIAGPASSGKTLLSNYILSKTVGGHAVANALLVDGSAFTGHYVKHPLMTIDDGECTTNTRAQARYESRIKNLIANPDMTYNEKYQQEGLVKWIGRIVITLNDDPEALRMIPDLNESLHDKVMVFRAQAPKKPFPPQKELEPMLDSELPYFLRWLLNWELPEHVKGSSRFGVKPFCHSHLHQRAVDGSEEQVFVDALNMYLAELRIEDRNRTEYTGNATELYNAMLNSGTVRDLAHKMKPNQVSRLLNKAEKRGYALSQKRTKTSREWHIEIPLTLRSIEDGTT